MMLACGSLSVPGTSAPRGSLSMSLTSCASLWRTTHPLTPTSTELRQDLICASSASDANPL
jgi:hypothetical protein